MKACHEDTNSNLNSNQEPGNNALKSTSITIFNYAYSCTDSFLSLLQVSEWLMFCSGNLILHQNRNENEKNTNYLKQQQQQQQQKKSKINYVNIK